MNARWLLLTLVVLFSTFAFAGSACNKATVLNADGRILDFDFVAPNTGSGNVNFYQFNVSANHSYSVEERQDYDDNQGAPSDLTTLAFTDSACTVALGVANTLAANHNVHDTSANDPALPGNAQRFSFTPTFSGPVYLQVTNANTTMGRYVSITVAETTTFVARWSTFSGFITQWGFQNTSTQPVTVTMTVTDTLGSPTVPPVTLTFAVPAGGETFHLTGASDINIAAQHGGFAVITTDGPPKSILGDAYFIGGNSTIIVPSTVSAVREASH